MKALCADTSSAESDWLHQLQRQDPKALACIMSAYYKDLYHYGSKFTRDEDCIKDSIQEVFISLWNKRDKAPSILSLRPYLLRAVKNRVIKATYRQQAQQYPIDLPEEYEFFQELSIDKILTDRQPGDENAARLGKLLGSLSKRQHEIIYLKYYQHLDNQQIATLMDISRQSVYNLLHETIQKLRSIWPRETLSR